MSISEIQKIKWRCRLGMLELDLLFGGYVDAKEAVIDSRQLSLLSDLLEEDNDVLERWLITESSSCPEIYQELCQDILTTAHKNI